MDAKDMQEFIEAANAIGLQVINFDWFHCDVCGNSTSDHEGGVTPTMNDAYCADCWPKYKHKYED